MTPQARIKTGDKKVLIYDCAKVLFSAKGFKETSVPDITKAAGIAAGTFYLYFHSKEDLFMTLYFDENKKLKKEILEDFDPNEEPFISIKKLIQQNMEGMAANPILREWYNREVFTKIEEKFREQNGLARVSFLYDSFLEIVEDWQAMGKLRDDIDSGMIMALFTAVITIDTHKDEIGLQYFPKIQEYLTQFIFTGLAPVLKTRDVSKE
jgi:AcrR family transcriptional regulator